MDTKDISPTIEQSLKMIEKEIEIRKKGKSDNKIFAHNSNILKKHDKKKSKLNNLFKRNGEAKKKILKKKKDDVLLLTNKVSEKKKINNLKEVKVRPNEKIKKKQYQEINLNIKDDKNLNKTTDMAVIIKKLRLIRDKKLDNNNRKVSQKIKMEIKKLNETIDLAEELFKKELLDL